MDRGRKQGRMKKEAISMYSLVPAHRKVIEEKEGTHELGDNISIVWSSDTTFKISQQWKEEKEKPYIY
uniref:Uncharacterized protein n=1 Tax=Oryza glumipatula TaxID=40148 RepID=A0A0D9YN16_9ORYZ